MLKKSLLAISLAAAVGTVNAGTLSAGGSSLATANTSMAQTVSSQAAVSVVKMDPVIMTVSKTASVLENYKTLDKVKVTITGATLSASSDAALGGLVINTEPTYPDASTVIFDVTNNTAANEGDTLEISGLDLAVDGTDVSFTVEAISSVAGVVIDSASGKVLEYVDEYSAKAKTKLNATIAFDRKKFTDGLVDVAEVEITNAAIDHGATVSSVGDLDVTSTLRGDFSFLDTDGDGKIEAGEGSIAGATFAADLMSASLKGPLGVHTYTITVDGKSMIPAQAYTADAVVNYTNSLNKAGTDSTTGIAMGSWAVDGTTDTLSFMPFGSAYANSITVTNMSTIAGEITVVLTSGGKSTAPTVVGTAAAKSVTQVGKEVAALAAANGMSDAQVSITVNADNVSIVGIYYSKADGDRVLTK